MIKFRKGSAAGHGEQNQNKALFLANYRLCLINHDLNTWKCLFMSNFQFNSLFSLFNNCKFVVFANFVIFLRRGGGRCGAVGLETQLESGAGTLDHGLAAAPALQATANEPTGGRLHQRIILPNFPLCSYNMYENNFSAWRP